MLDTPRHRKRRRELPLALGLCLALACPLAVAQHPPSPDVLHLGSLRGPNVAHTPPLGTWWVSTAWTYFNLWHYTWHVGSIHRHLDRLGEEVTEEEIRFLEQFWAGESMHQVDVEGWRFDTVISRRLWRDVSVTLTVPWVEVGRPNWDMVAERFHATIGVKNMRRDWFRRGRTMLFVHVPDGQRLEAHAELEGSGIGDVGLILTTPLGSWLGGEHRLALAVDAPTGTRNTLRGSGGWDTALQWTGTWSWRRTRLDGAAGYTWLDPSGTWLGLRRRNTWGIAAAAAIPVGASTDFLASLRYDTSPVDRLGELSRATAYYTLGVQRRVGAGHASFRVGENLFGLVPDWTFHLGYSFLVGAGGGALPGTR